MHGVLDQISLEMGRRVAARFRAHPDLLDVARANLARWLERNADAPSLVRNYQEWQRLLGLPLDEICQLLETDSDEAQRLRQNAPFAGLLRPAEVWALKAEIRKRHAAISA